MTATWKDNDAEALLEKLNEGYGSGPFNHNQIRHAVHCLATGEDITLVVESWHPDAVAERPQQIEESEIKSDADELDRQTPTHGERVAPPEPEIKDEVTEENKADTKSRRK